jgi:hypothetical protein
VAVALRRAVPDGQPDDESDTDGVKVVDAHGDDEADAPGDSDADASAVPVTVTVPCGDAVGDADAVGVKDDACVAVPRAPDTVKHAEPVARGVADTESDVNADAERVPRALADDVVDCVGDAGCDGVAECVGETAASPSRRKSPRRASCSTTEIRRRSATSTLSRCCLRSRCSSATRSRCPRASPSRPARGSPTRSP